MMKKNVGWANQSKRHSNAKKYGHAGGKYATPKARFKTSKWDGSTDSNSQYFALRQNGYSHDKAVEFIEGKDKKAVKPKKELSDRQKSNLFYEKTILDSIDADGFDIPEPKTPKEKLSFLKGRFESEFLENNLQAKRMSRQQALAEWYQGLPTNIPFYNGEIIELAKKGGTLKENASEREEQRVLDNYWNFMANKTLQAFRKYGVE